MIITIITDNPPSTTTIQMEIMLTQLLKVLPTIISMTTRILLFLMENSHTMKHRRISIEENKWMIIKLVSKKLYSLEILAYWNSLTDILKNTMIPILRNRITQELLETKLQFKTLITTIVLVISQWAIMIIIRLSPLKMPIMFQY